jgi:prepilin-type N-terminal cleavage/methylation domain-containing protein
VRRQDGFTLIEVLLVSVLFVIVLTATLSTFDRFVSDSRESDVRLESVEKARRALDVEVRQLRNLAIRLNNVEVIHTLSDDDFIFQTSDPTRTWVRYCLDNTDPTNAKLWQGQLAVPVGSTAPVAVPSGACPGDGWSQKTVVAENVVNRINGAPRPVFDYRCADGTTTTCRVAGSFAKVIAVNATLYVDTTPNAGPKEMRVSSGVYLRNQNQKPIASFSFNDSGIRRTILNGSQSSDFEGRTLRYHWFRGTVAEASIRCDNTTTTQNADGTQTMWGGDYIGTGVSYNVDWNRWSTSLASPQIVTLVVCDPGDSYGHVVNNSVTFRTS